MKRSTKFLRIRLSGGNTKKKKQLDETWEALDKIMSKAMGLSLLPKNASEDDAFFHAINCDSNLKTPFIKKRLQKAVQENDVTFFIRFGASLKLKSKQSPYEKLAFTLASRWAVNDGKIPQLSWFTDDALLEILKILTGNEKLTFDLVRKARQRLGLKTKDKQVIGVRRVGSDSFKLQWVDKAKK